MKKIITIILAIAMMVTYLPATVCYAAGVAEYESATEIEFNKLYTWTTPRIDEYTGETYYAWYKFTPKTQAETKVEMMWSELDGGGTRIDIYDSLLQVVKVRKNKLDLEINSTYYIRIHIDFFAGSSISFMLKTSPDAVADGNTDNTSGSTNTDNAQDGASGSANTDNAQNNTPNSTNPPSDSSENNQTDGNGSDIGDVDSDFWDESGSNGSGVYDDELPVPEITEIENGSNSVNIAWSVEDADDIDGYYIFRSKDGKNWNKIATIQDTEVEDYEDKDVADGDVCGYIVCSYLADAKSENSVPGYSCFLKKVSIKSVRSIASKKLNVKWSTNSNSSGYRIRVSTTKSFTKTTTIEPESVNFTCK